MTTIRPEQFFLQFLSFQFAENRDNNDSALIFPIFSAFAQGIIVVPRFIVLVKF
jgi:hypothetical protein